MATHLPEALTPGAACDNAVLPVSPFYAPRYQFGMLLGVDDFDLAEAYPRGKMRLHNAWLHREGVVWGFGVTASKVKTSKGDTEELTGEIRVEPGLALDAAGHELHLDRAACLDAVAWYQKQRQDKVAGVPVLEQDGTVKFKAHVALRFHACLTRPVPSMSEPCDPSSSGVAYSRVFETVELKLVPGEWTRPHPDPYHLLRMLFGLEGVVDPLKPTPDEKEVATALGEVESALLGERGAKFLEWFRRFAARDVTALSPGKSADGTMLLVPGADDAPIVLANLTITLTSDTGGLHLTKAVIDTDVRPAHVATSTIQELNLWRGAEAAPDAGGPRVVGATRHPAAKVAAAVGKATSAAVPHLDPREITEKLTITTDKSSSTPAVNPIAHPVNHTKETITITLTTDKPLDRATVHSSAFSITCLEATGWTAAKHTVTFDNDKRVTIAFTVLPGSTRLRLVAHGTGPTPILDTTGLPLAGGKDDPRPGRPFDGNDYVYMEGVT